MAWNDIKSTLESRPDVPDDKKLTAAEWNAMTADQQAHSTRHEQGGSDELSVSGLAGVLADPQTPEQEAVEDIVAALTVGGTNVDVAYDDGAGTLTISTPALADQEVRDLIDTVVVGGTQVSTTYDGTNLTVDIDAPTQAEFDTHSARHEDGGADELDVSNLSGVLADAQTPQTEAVQDIVGALVAGGTNVTVTYDDTNDVLTIDTSALNTEEVEDAVGALVTAGNAITVNYDDPNDSLSVGVDESALSFYDGTNLTAPVDNQSVNTEDSVTVTTGEATNTLHYGSNQDRANAGNESVAVGIGARANGDDGSGGSINQHVSAGYQAAQNNTGNNVTAAGYRAAQKNTGLGVTAAGYAAARDNTGNNVTAAGYAAARDNTGFGVTAVGDRAARDNTGNRVTAAGYAAARDNTDNRVTAAGYAAAQNNTGNDVTAAGYRAARDNTGNRVTAVGDRAARDNTGNRVTAAGYEAAQNNTGNDVTAAGDRAARGDGLADPTTMGDDNIGLGKNAIRNNQASGLIAIGKDAGINAQTDDQLIITQRNGTRRMVMDLTTGDLSITGSLTENASL